LSKIVYIGYYDDENKRACSPAAVTMMDYVIKAVNYTAKELVVISPAQLKSSENIGVTVKKVSDSQTIVYTKAYSVTGKRNLFKRLLHRIGRSISLYNALDKWIDEGDTVIVYHSPALIKYIRRIRKKKKIRFILHMCEIYSDVTGDARARKKEIAFAEKADAYIFATDYLEKVVNIRAAAYTVCPGTYSYNRHFRKESSEKKHIVYAGTFDMKKGGALKAIEIAPFLGYEYHIHIIGFGTERETEEIKQRISEIGKKSECFVSYDGCLKGEEYERFLQKCDIGLSTQLPDAEFSKSSFPSKILTYMANGLRVVSVRIPVVMDSPVGEYIIYSDDASPEKIAESIRKIDFSDGYSCEEILSRLDKAFIEELGKII